MTTVANSGAEDPAAMKVAPATSGVSFSSGSSEVMRFLNLKYRSGYGCVFPRAVEWKVKPFSRILK